jgi:glycerol-3-phosphate dehydrogenase
MWTKGWREQVWEGLDRQWELIVVGGGITGAGILREASRLGFQALLVEGRDFAAGTSSRSSKLVHGGLRYLGNLQFKLVFESIRERERLLGENRGLIEPLENIIASCPGDRPPGWVLGAALTVYDLLALKWRHKHHTPEQIRKLCPPLALERMTGGHSYFDARTDDARLVLRVIGEAMQAGGTALNYARVAGLLRGQRGQVQGIQLRDEITGKEREARAPVVISATGAWADSLRGHLSRKPRLRALRGSHLFFSREKLPLTLSISFLHPADGRPVFAFPWEGVTLVGTTDIDQGGDVPVDPRISGNEIDYLMQAVKYAFGPLGLGLRDVQSTISGVRSVVDTGQANPSRESREFVLWDEDGLLTATGGKLTTFRLMARKALQAVRRRLPDARSRTAPQNATAFGDPRTEFLAAAAPEELGFIGKSPALWAELRWAARAEAVVRLEDLLLRRVRLGLIAPEGGLPLMDRIRSIVQPELGWDDARWQSEANDYARLWCESYSAAGI